MAGAATLHARIAHEYGVSDDLPCADNALLVPLKRSPEYGTIRKRVANLLPVDSWSEDGFHFFVFTLKPDTGDAPPHENPMAVFTMHPESTEPVSAITVTPLPDGTDAQITDLRAPAITYTAPLPPEAAPAPTQVQAAHDSDEVVPSNAASDVSLIVSAAPPHGDGLSARQASRAEDGITTNLGSAADQSDPLPLASAPPELALDHNAQESSGAARASTDEQRMPQARGSVIRLWHGITQQFARLTKERMT